MKDKKCSFCDTPWSKKEQKLRNEIGRLNKRVHKYRTLAESRKNYVGPLEGLTVEQMADVRERKEHHVKAVVHFFVALGVDNCNMCEDYICCDGRSECQSLSDLADNTIVVGRNNYCRLFRTKEE